MTTVSELVTANFPLTDAKLAAYTDIDYATVKTTMIDRAKRDLYGVGVTVPTEVSIPDVALYWIADKATLYLIPVAKDYYMNQTRLSDSKENANFSYYDRIRALDTLAGELQTALAKNHGDALDAIDDSDAPEAYESAPEVSVDGLLLDPTGRAYYRGAF